MQRTVYDDLLKRIAERAVSIRLGDPLDLATEMGTVANEPQFNRIMDFIASAKEEGARLVTGGERATEGHLANGDMPARPFIAAAHTRMRKDCYTGTGIAASLAQ